MRNRLGAITIMGCLAVLASGQTSPAQKVLRFANLSTPEGYARMATVLRAVTEAPSAVADPVVRTLTVNGTAGQLAAAEWIFQKLDNASGTNDPQITDEFSIPGTSGDVVRIFVLRHTEPPQQVQEMISALRSIVELRQVAAFSNAIVARSTQEDLRHVGWIVAALDRVAPDPASTPATAGYDLNASGERSPAVRVFYIRYLATPVAMQELVNALRSISEVQRIMPMNGPRAIVCRASADQVAVAEWMIGELDRPSEPVTHKIVSRLQVRTATQREAANEVRVILVPQTTPQSLQTLVNQIRSSIQMPRTLANAWRTAVVMRGTYQQVTEAERIVDEQSK